MNAINQLLKAFPRADLALLPTPIVQLSALGESLGHPALFIKQDNLSGAVYGGNKIRKLEYLLGDALSKGCKTVITYGAAGSNHALANALCCRKLGLQAVSILAPQPTSAHVRKNILMHSTTGAEMVLCEQYTEFPEVTDRVVRRYAEKDGIDPYIIPAGGTNSIGALGFVQAALELAEQLQPDVIYIPMGTGGTHAGLVVGLKLAGLKTRIEAVRVTHPRFKTEVHIRQLCRELCETIKVDLDFSDDDIRIRNGFFGDDYGIPTAEGRTAVELLEEKENVHLENTYTGKTAAALLHDVKNGALGGQTVLYWNTLNSRDLSEATARVDYHGLSPEWHSYFE